MMFHSSGICHISFIPSQLIHCFSSLYTVGIPLWPTEITCLSVKVSDFSLSFNFVPATSASSEFTMDSWTLSFVHGCPMFSFPHFPILLFLQAYLCFLISSSHCIHLTQHTTIFILLSLTIYELGSLILTSMLKPCGLWQW